ncbi:MAG: RIP metalloprotease RseP [Bacteroidaceae bacterium]|nr:RIP metalloprotease RseP [Bacteroidaceae bacterium]
MSVFQIKTLQLILCFALLIVLHEGGHFFFAKLFKVRVEKFFMFFDYKFHLFSTKDKWFTRLFPKFKNKETEYGIGWIPLGGYVKISGMIDESMDTEQMKQPVKDYEFRAKPVWQRFFIMIGGVLVNFLLALFIYAMILFAWGDDKLPVKSITNGFSYNEMAEGVGFQDGDLPVKIDGKDITYWNDSYLRDISRASTVTVMRDGHEVAVLMPDEGLNLIEMTKSATPFMSINVPAVIDSVLPESPAAKAGISKGSRIMGVDGRAIEWWGDFDVIMASKAMQLAEPDCSRADSMALRQMTIVFAANGQSLAEPDTVEITLTEQYMMGIVKTHYAQYYTIEHHDYGFFESLPAGAAHGWRTLGGYVSDLRYLFTSDGAKNVGSFGTIGNLFPAQFDWQAFWYITAFISIMLAFMNILPIPGLDGGHVFFLLVEAVTRRPPSDKFMERAQMVGMALLLALMALALFNDVVKFLF